MDFWWVPRLFVLPKPAGTEPSQCSGTSWFTLWGLSERLLCNREELLVSVWGRTGAVTLVEGSNCDLSDERRRELKAQGRRMTRLFEGSAGPKCLCFAPPFPTHLGTHTHIQSMLFGHMRLNWRAVVQQVIFDFHVIYQGACDKWRLFKTCRYFCILH